MTYLVSIKLIYYCQSVIPDQKSWKSWKAMRYSVMVFPCKGTSAHIFDRNSFRTTSFRINLGSNLCSKSQLISNFRRRYEIFICSYTLQSIIHITTALQNNIPFNQHSLTAWWSRILRTLTLSRLFAWLHLVAATGHLHPVCIAGILPNGSHPIWRYNHKYPSPHACPFLLL